MPARKNREVQVKRQRPSLRRLNVGGSGKTEKQPKSRKKNKKRRKTELDTEESKAKKVVMTILDCKEYQFVCFYGHLHVLCMQERTRTCTCILYSVCVCVHMYMYFAIPILLIVAYSSSTIFTIFEMESTSFASTCVG